MEIYDRIAKQKLNVIILVDASTSMRGVRINQVNQAIADVRDYLRNLQTGNVNVDFYMTVITFSTEAYFKNNKKMIPVNEFEFEPIKAGGWSNLHLAYDLLGEILNKESNDGIMPDFGGVAPIILLLTDGHPSEDCKNQLEVLKTKAWFNVALRYGIAIELNDDRTKKVLKEFVGSNGEVIDCYDARLLERIIKIIVLTASKVKSQSSMVTSSIHNNKTNCTSQIANIQQQIDEELNSVDDWEW